MGIYYEHILTLLNDGSTKTLDKAPIGWDTFERSYERSPTYHGILRSEGGDLRFVNVGGRTFDKGGYFFIKDAMDTYGIKAQIKYEKKRRNNFTWGFDDDYVGLMDLTTDGEPVEFPHENYIEIRCIESGKLQSFVANSEKNYSLDSLTATNGNTITAFSNNPKNIIFPPINLYLEGNTVGNFYGGYFADGTDTDPYTRTEIPLNTIGDRLIESDLSLKIYDNTTDDTIDATIYVKYSYDMDITIAPDGVGTQAAQGELYIRTVVRDSGGSELDTYTHSSILWDEIIVDETKELNYTGSVDTSISYSIPAGGYVEFYIWYNASNNNTTTFISPGVGVDNYDIVEKYESITTASIPSWFTYETATRLIQLMTGETDTSKLIESNIFGRTNSEFQTYGSNGARSLIITVGGLVIRDFPNSTTKVNFKDWFKSIDRMANIALWFPRNDDFFKIEEKEQVYRDDQILDLGVVSNLRIKPYKGGYWTQLLTGTSEKGDYEQEQGVFEYNIQSEHETDMPIVNKLDLRVIYNTDSLTAEFARRNQYSTTGNEDTKQDDKVFIGETDGTSIITFTDADTDSFRGIEERYNGNYTPRRCILNNGNWLAGMFWKDSGNNINFVNNSKDINITYDGVNEQDPIPQADLGTPLFYPRVFECDFKSNYDMIEQLETDPHGYIKLTSSDGDDYYVYID